MSDYTKEQTEAINTIEKNLQIIACAGSGKTQVISERIINILKKGTPPSKIIAFTYTEKAAGELKARVLKLCREQFPELKGLAEMYIGTIHAWCLNTLRNHKYEYQKFSVLDEIKLKLFVDRKFKDIGMKLLNMERFKNTGHFIQLMGILREAEFIDVDKVPKKLFDALTEYESILRKNCYLDFTMIMSEMYKYLDSDVSFQNKIKNNLGYLVVDEYQDVNPIQEKIVRKLYELGANVCVVGDDDQTIFQWRGSHIEYIQKFSDRYKNVKEIILKDNFRSSNSIVDVALKCITNNKKRILKKMESKGHQVYERGDIIYNQFNSVNEENESVINTIQNLRGVKFCDKQGLERGLDYSDFVILIRKWKKADAIIGDLEKAKIPFIVTGVNNLFLTPEVAAAKAIFDFLDRTIDSDVLIHHWTSLSGKIQKNKLEDTVKYLEKKRPYEKMYYESFILQDIFWEFLDLAGIREDVFTDSGNEVAGFNSEEVVFYNLGMFSQIINDFETIYFNYSPQIKLKTFLNFLKYSADDYYPEGWQNNTYKTPNAVQIMTIYQAKGLEFPVVFIPGLNKNYLPTSQPTGTQVWHFIDRSLIKDSERYFPTTEDERRLMYVAITRSKKFLIVSRAPDGRQQGKESVFGEEIRRSDYLLSSKDRNYSERKKIKPESNTDLSNISLNFTLLKDFFDCPYKFKFYSFYGFRNPLGARIGFGASIHNTLMEIHREFLSGLNIKRNELPEILGKHINYPYALPEIIKEMTSKANKSVEIYYDENASTFKEIEFAEKEIQLDLGDGIIVNGKMDLIKRKMLDGTIEKTIIDFKSTEDAQAYSASIDQLQLYALGYHALTGENADILELYNLDKNEKHRNELTVKDLSKMKDKIVKAANDIRNNNVNETCGDPKCPCKLKKSN